MALAARDPHAAQENREKVLKSFETFHANFIFQAAAGGTFDFRSLLIETFCELSGSYSLQNASNKRG